MKGVFEASEIGDEEGVVDWIRWGICFVSLYEMLHDIFGICHLVAISVSYTTGP